MPQGVILCLTKCNMFAFKISKKIIFIPLWQPSPPFFFLTKHNVGHSGISKSFSLIFYYILYNASLLLSGKESACNAGDTYRRWGFNPWVRKIPWKRKWQSIPVFLPGESHGQRSLAGYSPWGSKRAGHDLASKQQHKLYIINYIYIINTYIKDIYVYIVFKI